MATSPDVSFATRVSNKLFPKRAAKKAHEKMIMDQFAAETAKKDMENFRAMNATDGKTGYSKAVVLRLLRQGQDGVVPDFATKYSQDVVLRLLRQGKHGVAPNFAKKYFSKLITKKGDNANARMSQFSDVPDVNERYTTSHRFGKPPHANARVSQHDYYDISDGVFKRHAPSPSKFTRGR